MTENRSKSDNNDGLLPEISFIRVHTSENDVLICLNVFYFNDQQSYPAQRR